jgi:hypothetical protein
MLETWKGKVRFSVKQALSFVSSSTSKDPLTTPSALTFHPLTSCTGTIPMLHDISPSTAARGPAACRSTITPQLFQEYHPMKTPSNATGTSEPWNVIANIAHDGTINALWMLSHVGSGYMRVIRCCLSHVKVQAGRLPFTAGWLAVCLLACSCACSRHSAF